MSSTLHPEPNRELPRPRLAPHRPILLGIGSAGHATGSLPPQLHLVLGLGRSSDSPRRQLALATFAVWATVLQFLLKKTIMPDTIKVDRIKSPLRDLPIIKYTVYSTCAISAATWRRPPRSTPFPAATLFIPNVAATKTEDEFIRMFMQFDWIFFMSACMLWLLYLFGDLKSAGMMDASWVSIIIRGLITFVAAGPGVVFGLGWWWREQLLATRWHKDALVAAKSK